MYTSVRRKRARFSLYTKIRSKYLAMPEGLDIMTTAMTMDDFQRILLLSQLYTFGPRIREHIHILIHKAVV